MLAEQAVKQDLVLVLNCGSSSLKFSILNPSNEEIVLAGLAECFFLPEAKIHWTYLNKTQKAPLASGAGHAEALLFLSATILPSAVDLQGNLIAIGHRVVHGGELFSESVRITESVVEGIDAAKVFAPLHNPAALIGIRAATQLFPELRDSQVAVFDTSFHQSLPEEAYLYALPYDLYQNYKIRRYGFHGMSHEYVSRKGAQLLGIPYQELHAISCHLGNGASVAAIKNGKSIDTSMGLTPLEGLMMGTRSGDLDPAIIFYLHESQGMSIAAIEELLIKQSGFQGITKVTSDCRYVEENYGKNVDATRAMNIFCHRLAKYIASYAAVLEGRLDLLIFTGGIGENAILVREMTLGRLSLLGFTVNAVENRKMKGGNCGMISDADSRMVAVIPTNEEVMIARNTAQLID